MRAKKIFEKFTEDSDPISDLGIGMFVPRTFNNINEFCEWIYKHAKPILGMELKDAISKTEKYFLVPYIYDKLRDYMMKYITILNYPRAGEIGSWPRDLKEFVLNKKINEKFTEDSDPISDMGIGITHGRDFKDIDNFVSYVIQIIKYLHGGEIPEDILTYKLTTYGDWGILPRNLFTILCGFLHKHQFSWQGNYNFDRSDFMWPTYVKKKLLELGYKEKRE